MLHNVITSAVLPVVQVRTLRQQNGPSVMRQTTGAFSPFPTEGSLAMELEDMMRRDAYPASSSPEQRRWVAPHGGQRRHRCK